MSKKHSRLPAGLQEVEWLESTGSQYINTNQIAKTNITKIEARAKYTGTDTVGCLYGANATLPFFQINKTAKPNEFRLIVYAGDMFYTLADYNEFHNYSLQGKDLYIDDLYVTTASRADQYNTRSIQLFSRQGSQYGKWAIQSFKIYYDGITINRNYVPCRVTAEGWTDELGNPVSVGAKGMYDLVNAVLYTNKGTGEDFIAGPDV